MRPSAVCALLLGFIACTSFGQTQDPVPIARKALDLLLAAQFHELREMFTDRMLQAVTEDTLRMQVGANIQALGKPQKIGDPMVKHVQNLFVVTFPVQFANKNVNVVLPVDESGKIAGLGFAQGENLEQKWTPPAYVDPASFRTREVTVGEGEWKLPGTLTVPNGAGPFPALVLVQGSGPLDRDETIGPNKPFRDLAEGLASSGIAVLRYDKRTKVYGQQMAAIKDLTVEQETIADALNALALLHHQPEIDSKRVFLLGHSLGAYLGPRIAERAPGLAGLILMAGITRPLEDVMLEQYQYLKTSPDELQMFKQQAYQVHNLKSADGPNLLGAPPAYWLDLNSYDPKAAVKKLHCRILVLQGGRDYQVTQPDYAGWQAALQGDPRAAFHIYPSLNHLFITGEGPSIPAEYEKPGHVSPEVIHDVAAWIKQ